MPRDIGSFLLFLAGSEACSRTGKPGKSNLPRTPEAARTFLAPISGMLFDWPGGFSHAVRERLAAGQVTTLPERLGKWYNGLMRFRSEAYADFRTVLSEVAAQAFDGTYGGAVLKADTEHAWISAAEAAASRRAYRTDSRRRLGGPPRRAAPPQRVRASEYGGLERGRRGPQGRP
jgi:hypothetical protein